MPLIQSKQKIEKEHCRISIEKNILEKVNQYCEWAEIKKLDDFFEQAAEYILSKDREWLKHLQQKEPL